MNTRNLFALAWGMVLAVLLALGANQFLERRVTFDTDILALLPKTERDPVLQTAFSAMVDAAQQKMVVLVGGRDWDDARAAATAYRDALRPHQGVLEIAATDEQSQQDWLALFRAHRHGLMTGQDEQSLRDEPPAHWVERALARLYSPVSGPQAGAWQDDPFGLFGGWMQARAMETPVRPRDGHLHVSGDGREYVVLPITLHVPAFSMDAQQTVMPLLQQAGAAARSATPSAEVLASGFILHAASASRRASMEMTAIGIGSLGGILLLVWLSFRSLKPMAYILLLIGVGCAGALSVCLLLFERVHLLTLVFGATLIGVAQDYGIYFLCNRVAADAREDSVRLMRRLLPGLALTLAAATIGYLGLALTPFPGLQQMSVFSVSGLLIAWLTVLFWYPALIGPTSLDRARLTPSFDNTLRHWPVFGVGAKTMMTGALLACVIVFGWSRLQVNDDIRALQSPDPDLVAQQTKLGKLLDVPAPAQFYLVRGTSAEAVLEREEALKDKLDPLVAQGTITGYQAVSNWVPSQRKQGERRALVEDKLFDEDAALALLASHVGEDAAWIEAMRQRAAAGPALTTEAFLASQAGEAWRHLWLGKVDGEYASMIALRGASLAALPALRDAAAGVEGAQWVDKVAEVSSVLGSYREYMSAVLAASFGLVSCLLFLRYRGSAWRALAPTLLAGALTLALFGLAGYPLQLFHVLALMLLLGIGVDYGIFFQERSDRCPGSAWLAVCLSAASTILAFGLLGTSSNPALRAFGLTMLIGVALVWLLVPCFRLGYVSAPALGKAEEACGA